MIPDNLKPGDKVCWAPYMGIVCFGEVIGYTKSGLVKVYLCDSLNGVWKLYAGNTRLIRSKNVWKLP